MKDQRILITGGTGVLGTQIVEALLADGFTNIDVFSRSGAHDKLPFRSSPYVTFTKGDVVELYPLTESIESADYIINAAAIVSFSPKKFDQMHAVNVDGTANVMNIALDNNVKKVVHISSIAALGRDGKSDIITEQTKWTNSEYNSYYGITKYLAEQEAWRAHHEGLDIVIVNPSLVFGDKLWDQSSLQIFKKAYDGLPYYPAGGTGIVDVVDVADVIVHLMKSEISGEKFIISGGNILYKDLFQKMAKSMGRKMPKKLAPKWMLSVLWRIEKLRTSLSGSEPIVTRESVKSTSLISRYDNSKSKEIGWGEYKNINTVISDYSKKYAKSRQ